MDQYTNNDSLRLVIAAISFVALLALIFYIYRYAFYYFRKKVSQTPGKLDDFILDLIRIPALWLIYWILIKIFTHFFLTDLPFFPFLQHFNSLLLIFALAWIAIQMGKAGSYYLQNKLDINATDNLNARKSLTQIKIFQGIVNSIIVIIAISIGLLTFEQARNIGLSLLTSAGIFGIIVGFAAQKSIGMFLAGIQIAITQPIRLDDVVIVEGEWGRIEEITLSYVVVKIWDERRLMLPVTYFLEKPFQNWTRSSAAIMGTVFFYVGYDLPVQALRDYLPELLNGNPNWDERVSNVQVTNTNEVYKEVRILVSSSDASKNWDLRTEIREKVIDFIQANYPECFVKVRLNNNHLSQSQTKVE